MSLCDNKWWLLSHIHHSFLLCDETGNTEMVFATNDQHVIRKQCERMAR